jgi:hypothetical protein
VAGEIERLSSRGRGDATLDEYSIHSATLAAAEDCGRLAALGVDGDVQEGGHEDDAEEEGDSHWAISES